MSSPYFRQRNSLAFGIEMEMLVRPNLSMNDALHHFGWDPSVQSESDALTQGLKPERNRVALRRALVALISRELPNIGLDLDYTNWSIVDESSLDEFPQFWRIEIVSRILKSHEQWQAELEAMFDVLTRHCDIALSTGCSMHVHVSLSEEETVRYSARDIRSILKAIAYYDDPITRVMPADRKANMWAMANMQATYTSKAVKSAYAQVPQLGWKPMFDAFDKVEDLRLIHQYLFGEDRYVSWNFANLTKPCGTIEFRRPPGVQSASQATLWAAFALGFIGRAMDIDWDSRRSSTGYASVHDLNQFIFDGLDELSLSRGILGWLKEDTNPPLVHSAAELASIARKKVAKSKKNSPYAEKASSRPATPV